MPSKSEARLYKGRYMIALYDIDKVTRCELECLVIVNNIRGLLKYFSICVSNKEICKMKDKIYLSLHNPKKDRRKIILVNGEEFKIGLIPERRRK